jgi:Arc/MetJ-type ribon-helix-helix transcriptional regulator
MIVCKTLSIPIEDLGEIERRIEDGKEKSVSGFVQKAIKNELKR